MKASGPQITDKALIGTQTKTQNWSWICTLMLILWCVLQAEMLGLTFRSPELAFTYISTQKVKKKKTWSQISIPTSEKWIQVDWFHFWTAGDEASRLTRAWYMGYDFFNATNIPNGSPIKLNVDLKQNPRRLLCLCPETTNLLALTSLIFWFSWTFPPFNYSPCGWINEHEKHSPKTLKCGEKSTS